MTINFNELLMQSYAYSFAICLAIHLYFKLRRALREFYLYRKRYQIMKDSFSNEDFGLTRGNAYGHYLLKRTAWTKENENKFIPISNGFFRLMIVSFLLSLAIPNGSQIQLGAEKIKQAVTNESRQ